MNLLLIYFNAIFTIVVFATSLCVWFGQTLAKRHVCRRVERDNLYWSTLYYSRLVFRLLLYWRERKCEWLVYVRWIIRFVFFPQHNKWFQSEHYFNVFSFRWILLHVANTSLQNKSKPNADLFLWNWNDKMDLHFIVKVSNILVKKILFSDKKLVHVYLFVKFPRED